MAKIIVIAHNIRSTHNIGSILRTSEGLGVEEVIISGYSPYPELPNDDRLPHIREKLTNQISKTSLGAEKLIKISRQETPDLNKLRQKGYRIVGLEQSPRSIMLPEYDAPEKITLLLGEEVNGINDQLLSQCDDTIEIPMRGKKESFNVSVAAGIAIYQLTI